MNYIMRTMIFGCRGTDCIYKTVSAQRREGDDAFIVWKYNVAIGSLDEDGGEGILYSIYP